MPRIWDKWVKAGIIDVKWDNWVNYFEMWYLGQNDVTTVFDAVILLDLGRIGVLAVVDAIRVKWGYLGVK